MSGSTYQFDADGNLVGQTQSGPAGAADVNVAAPVAIDQNANGVKMAVAPLNASSPALEASRIIKTAPGVLFEIAGYNSKVSAQFIQLFDSTTLPAEGAIPKYVMTAAASSNFAKDFGIYGMTFINGIVACNSSTAPTKTIGSADVFFTARYV